MKIHERKKSEKLKNLDSKMDLRQKFIDDIDEKFDSLGWDVEKLENEETRGVTWNIFDMSLIRLKPLRDKVILYFGGIKVIFDNFDKAKVDKLLGRVTRNFRRKLFIRALNITTFINDDILKDNGIETIQHGTIIEDGPNFLYQSIEWEFDDNRKIVLNLFSIEITNKDGDTIKIQDIDDIEYLSEKLHERIVNGINIKRIVHKVSNTPKLAKNKVSGTRLPEETINAIDEKLQSSGLVFEKDEKDIEKSVVYWKIKDSYDLTLKSVGYKYILYFRIEKLILVKFDRAKIDKFMNSVISTVKRKLFGHAFNIQNMITDFLDDNGIEYNRYGGISQTGEEEDFLDQTEWNFSGTEIRLNLYSLEVNGDFLEDISDPDNVIDFIKEKTGYKDIHKINTKLMRNLATLTFSYKPKFRFISLTRTVPFVLKFKDATGQVRSITVNDEGDLVRAIVNL